MLRRAIEESEKEAKKAAALQEASKKLRQKLPSIENRPKGPAGGFDDINIEDDDLQDLQEEFKESKSERSACLKATRDALIL